MIAFSFSIEKDGFLACKATTVDGKERKYYRITPKGRSLLRAMKEKIEELHQEVIKHP